MQLAASAALHDLCSFHRPNKVAYLHQLEQQFLAGNCDVGAKLLHTLPSSGRPSLKPCALHHSACGPLATNCTAWPRVTNQVTQGSGRLDVDALPHTVVAVQCWPSSLPTALRLTSMWPPLHP